MAGELKTILSAGASCRMGRRRSNNEDNFYLDGYFKPLDKADTSMACSAQSPGGGVYAVFDGMGGQAYGERAAWMGAYGLSLFQETLLQRGQDLSQSVDQCVKAVNLSIVRQSEKLRCSMGSTLVLAILWGAEYHIFNLGDSRAYLYSGGSLSQLSRDHTETQSLIDMGILPPKPADGEKDGSLIQYLGIPTDEMILEPHSVTGRLGPGDRLLLCSDGLTDMLSDDKIALLLSQTGSPEELASRLTHAAERAGGKDNVTALVISAESCAAK